MAFKRLGNIGTFNTTKTQSLNVDAAVGAYPLHSREGQYVFTLEPSAAAVQEIGAFLSGGTDSSTLVGLMSKVTADRIKTFSVGFAEERYNEIHYARTAAAHFNADAHEHLSMLTMPWEPCRSWQPV